MNNGPLFGPTEGWSLEPVATWLLTEGRRARNGVALATGLVAQLDAVGAKIDRLRVTTTTLHPQLVALGVFWDRAQGARLWAGAHGVESADAYIGSPSQFVRDSGQTYRRRLDAPIRDDEHATLGDLLAEGMTDYVALPLVSSSGVNDISTLAAQSPAGFSDADVARFTALSNLLAPLIENSDLRGFTSVCESALDAAIGAFDSIAVFNHRRRHAGLPVIELGLGLHLGTVTHANVGSPSRLAFNVVGPAVNMTARIQSLTKETGEPLLLSKDFSRLVKRPLRRVGEFDLRGISGPQEVFTPQEI